MNRNQPSYFKIKSEFLILARFYSKWKLFFFIDPKNKLFVKISGKFLSGFNKN